MMTKAFGTHWLFAMLLVLAGLINIAFTTMTTTSPNYSASPQFENGRFKNSIPPPPETLTQMAGIAWDLVFNKPSGTVPEAPVAIQKITRDDLIAAPDRSLYRLGHSSLLLKLQGTFWLVDPVFSKRVSPVKFAGPKRFHAPPISIEDLPPIRGVVLTHDHYDHLDRDTIVALAKKTETFLAPLGVGDLIIHWGVSAAKVHQFDWWQNIEIDGLKFTATPAQHFSGRGLFDQNKTLWASWVIEMPTMRIFLGGDSGYFPGFREIGDRLGPFNVTLLEVGAYDTRWPYIHMQPEQSVQAHQDLGGRVMVPIHNGTFDLAMHAWREPMERVSAIAAQKGIQLSTPEIGTRLSLDAPEPGRNWWN